ncbi:MAG: hypothetical protein COV72_05865 [Candidatus Omnitrophica bacterium CG11_big_fil_rev_8_21_14_0_20_42_13]|uniref:PilZ domain-containing protein n=1 Tax=Candidatus Ghiorseimicrobium undicola TaxID=1974746 RepID=A0A2H0LYQ8_9BACT|nr:MAG: hypothetical protein COV72_05865 [Candidatus Omnitrophica bacterium CG11_big_fil_rev_8_21_14_0_20_42_13]
MLDDASKRERRKFPRHYAVVADYKLANSEAVKASQVKNISAGGICLIVYEDIEIGSQVELKIYLPGSSLPILAWAKTLWKNEFKVESETRKRFDIGFEFLKIEELDRQKIAQYVNSSSNS